MGNTRSISTNEQDEDIWWTNSVRNEDVIKVEECGSGTEDISTIDRRKRIREELDEFKLDLARKHEKRRQLIAEKQKEFVNLRDEVKRLTQENQNLKMANGCVESNNEIQRLQEENEELRSAVAKLSEDKSTLEDIKQRNLELKMTIAETQKELQDLNSEVFNFEKERQDYKNHVTALKDVITVSKQMLLIRENQLKELRQKVSEIEASLAGKELSTLSQDLQKEYERQLQNMRNLRIFYEERLRAHVREKDELKSILETTKKELQDEKDSNSELKENIERLEEENSKKYDEIKNLESNLGLSKAESRQFQEELAVINQLFSQILLGLNNNEEIDMDKLIHLLEENHHLLQDIAVNEVSNESASALPKVLLDLVREASDKSQTNPEEQSTKSDKIQESQCGHQLNSASEIVENLPKVWRILIELLSHQCAPVNVLNNETKNNENPCYKVVETPKGSHLVLSVSQTFIRLKNLILEKKSLEKETCHLKQLNTHLECRLQEQERRLDVVSCELTDTWHLVGELQKKHQLLHTQEKILRYELAQKRKLLNELKDELEYSRGKWLEAREKNSTTEKQWEQLRTEFALRKSTTGDDLNNSVESGYSDGRDCSSEDEPGYETDVSECNQKGSSGDEPETEANIDANQGEIVDTVDGNLLVNSGDELDDSESRVLESLSDKDCKGSASNLDQEKDIIATTSSLPGTSNGEVDLATSSNDSVEKTLEDNCKASTSSSSLEKVLSSREERLKRLEGQCSSLVKQVVNTTNKSAAIVNKLDVLHEVYGEHQQDDVEEETNSNEEEPNVN